MPNWCSNSLTITHTDPELIRKAAEGFRGEGFLSAFMPIPKALQDTIAGAYADPVEQEALIAKQKANLAEYGYKDWYDWAVANWGTKWDISGEEPMVSEDGLTLTVGFQSAWSPPIEFYKVLENKFGFIVEAYFYEGGMCFYGEYSNGVENTTTFSCYDDLPDEIVDMFCVEDWEEEEAEEAEANEG